MKNKKGISLIVLIVTIIVIIILAAAVILTLNQNNPIDSSRVAQLSDNRASINSAVSLYYGKQMAATQGIYDANQIFTLTDVSDAHKTLIGNALVSEALIDDSNYYKLSDGENTILGISIPGMSNAKWCLDITTGLVYLTYESEDKVPAWMFTDNAKTTLDSTLSEFVKLQSVDTNGKLVDVVISGT